MAITAADIVTMALRDLGVIGPVDPPSAEDAAFGLQKLNILIDNMNAKREAIYASDLTLYTLTPALTPHTIGPAGTFVVTQRPVSLEAANWLDTSTPAVRAPITLRNEAWWLRVPVRGMTSEFVTDVFYEPTWPNGELNFWPVPTVAYQVELLTRSVLASMSLTTAFSMPPGYQDAITLTLEEMLIPAFKVAGPQGLRSDAARARARIGSNNITVPEITTRQAGMPGGRGGTKLDWRTREIV
ncbi:MAG TPA: hypothetical protein VLH81_07640 [Desulfobacterales bacterium]|nr:hypothetical protein [Desulfobacterales bacterium]